MPFFLSCAVARWHCFLVNYSELCLFNCSGKDNNFWIYVNKNIVFKFISFLKIRIFLWKLLIFHRNLSIHLLMFKLTESSNCTVVLLIFILRHWWNNSAFVFSIGVWDDDEQLIKKVIVIQWTYFFHLTACPTVELLSPLTCLWSC